jgi:hypothetical protein
MPCPLGTVLAGTCVFSARSDINQRVYGPWLDAALFDGHNGDAAARYLVKNLSQLFEGLLKEPQAFLTGHSEDAALSSISGVRGFTLASSRHRTRRPDYLSMHSSLA